MVEFLPERAKPVFRLVKKLADALTEEENELLKCNSRWATNLLAELGKLLTKFVFGSRELDTAHDSWLDVQTILTKNEIFSSTTSLNMYSALSGLTL